VAKIDSSDTYEKGKPKPGGLSDLRLGTMDKFGGLVCTTDGANSLDCPGYFGHIDLAKVWFRIVFASMHLIIHQRQILMRHMALVHAVA
jgi:DNA-directed RNA polymerase II subunit RPB1